MAYEVHGAGDPVVVFAPASGERHQWPAQAAYLARSHAVITIGPPGPAATDPVADLVAVLDACGARRAVLTGHCASGWTVLQAQYRGSTGYGRAYTQSLAARRGDRDRADVAAGILQTEKEG